MELPVLSVALSDPDPLRRERIVKALRCWNLPVAAEADAASDLTALDGDPWQAVVLGADALGPEELAQISSLGKAREGVRVVVVAESLENRSARGAFAAGADAVVLAARLEETLALAVRAAHAGQLSVPRDWRSQFGRPVLSVRQKQILAMVVLGFTNGKIGRTLGIAQSTVKSHLSSAFAKLGVKSRSEATDLILDPENGLGTGILTIDPDEGR